MIQRTHQQTEERCRSVEVQPGAQRLSAHFARRPQAGAAAAVGVALGLRGRAHLKSRRVTRRNWARSRSGTVASRTATFDQMMSAPMVKLLLPVKKSPRSNAR